MDIKIKEVTATFPKQTSFTWHVNKFLSALNLTQKIGNLQLVI